MPVESLPSSGLRYVRGIGPKRALALEKLGIHTLRDLLYYFPRRYEDRSRFLAIEDLKPGESSTVRGEILKAQLKRIRRLTIFELTVGDSSGTIHAVWFNQPYLKDVFSEGQDVILFGKADLYKNRLQFTSPEYEILDPGEEGIHTGRITPVYPLTEGLFQRSLRSILYDLVETHLEQAVAEYLPESFLAEKKLPPLLKALRSMHFPESFENLEEGRRRIAFDEFLLFELTLLKKIEAMKSKYAGIFLESGPELFKEFLKTLPFKPTSSQLDAMQDLARDFLRPWPMNRLLQGDVGSGKTVVAAFGLFLSARCKKQAALLVPTEILAEQHYRSLSALLEPCGITSGLLTSHTPAPKRERLMAELKTGKLPVLVGTHALFSEDVRFQSLALVVTDEQHKFGVHQRCLLLNREPRPHQLVMTATPIPRTLALTVYGDLEVSTMRDMPAGRQAVKTYWITRQKQSEVLAHILKKIKAGDQAYFIFPLIEETEKSDLLAAKKEFDRLSKGPFAGIKMGLVHGRVTPEDRERIMREFSRNEIKIIVSTSVIEVGVNHPNATMMVIENAERFGLAQLHQMRGRIGRGEKPSECFLFGEPKTVEGQKRLRILTKTQDGFQIAEEDLRLRGPGEFLGTRQSGDVFFRVADPIRDEELLLDARGVAQHLVKSHALETSPEWAPVKNFLEQFPLRY